MNASALNPDQICVALTGASGIPYGLRLIQQLLENNQEILGLISPAGAETIRCEADADFPETVSEQQASLCRLIDIENDNSRLKLYEQDDWQSPLASGSSAPRRMVICPCSMSTLSSVACGASNNLIERAADVVLKERGKLVIVPRETPLSTIHLQNMLTLSQAGAVILPPSPGFYQQPESVYDLIDFVVGRILDQLDIAHSIGPRWSDQPVI